MLIRIVASIAFGSSACADISTVFVGLNDDRWHNVSVTVDLLTALLTVDVTSASNKEHRLMTLMTSAITSPADESWNPVSSVISLGG